MNLRELACQLRWAGDRAAGVIHDLEAAQRAVGDDPHLAEGLAQILADAEALRRRTGRLLRVVELLA